MAIIVYIWNKRKMKAYKTDRTNQGSTYFSAVFSFHFTPPLLATNEHSQFWKSIISHQSFISRPGEVIFGEKYYWLCHNHFLLSLVFHYHNLNPAFLQRHTNSQAYAFFTQPLTLSLVLLAALPAFSIIVPTFSHYFQPCWIQTTEVWSSTRYIHILYTLLSLFHFDQIKYPADF